jgi:FAD/FMN-containing dehydrogenase
LGETTQVQPAAQPSITDEVLEGYGMRQKAPCRVVRPCDAAEMAAALAYAREQGLSVGLRGSGCSYGDAALNAGQLVLDCSRMRRILAWDAATGVITVEPGVTIEDLWRATLADGWWPPVIPGTMAVSVGGAAAGNIHGKNQWRHGSFGQHILRFELLLTSGEILTCSPEEHPDLYSAAIGGWGLLGCFTAITLQLRRIHSGLVAVRQTAHRSLDELLAALDAGTRPGADGLEATHLVGWIDTGARGKRVGRGLLKSMRELGPGEDSHPERTLDPQSQPPPSRIFGVLPTSWVPILGKPIATPLGIRVANYAIWRRGNLPGASRPHLERYVPANFMLNFFPNFKRVYRPGGLIQHQTFAPRTIAVDLFREVLARSQRRGVEPSLAVLKSHQPSPFLLNYLPDGYSLALDYAMPFGRRTRTLALMQELNELVAAAGGGFFLAKDSTLRPDEFARAFAPEALARFRALKAEYDPEELLQTDIYRRVVKPALAAVPQGSHAVSAPERL